MNVYIDLLYPPTPPRLATPLSYFISEMLCVPRSQLDNVREIPLLVTTVTIPSATDMMPPQPKRQRLLPENGIDKLLKESKGWVLDFDLDFFSTGNPYRGPFTSVSGCGVCVCGCVCGCLNLGYHNNYVDGCSNYSFLIVCLHFILKDHPLP